ncbi:hypothetical protein ACA910_017768 [Epithemia clementina (nom. ined.)]
MTTKNLPTSTEIETEKTLENRIKPALDVRSRRVTAAAFTSNLPGAESTSHESRYWAEKFGLGQSSGKTPTFAHPRKAKLQVSSAAVVHGLAFGPPTFSHVSPLAVASGPRVRLYGTTPQSSLHRVLRNHSNQGKEQENIEADRQVQTGGSLSLAVAYRHDGRLLAVATDKGQVRVADATSRATLCTFQSPTKLAIRSIAWFRDGQNILAAGDDGVARVWSVAESALSAENASMELSGHGDAIRCAGLWQAPLKTRSKWPHPSMAFTGSYDHTVRIWDTDQESSFDDGADRCLAVLVHGAPVESLLLMPSSNRDVPVWVLSAGGTQIKVWNPLTGLCVCKSLSHHRKTITSLVAIPRTGGDEVTPIQMRVMTGGLDALLRFHSWDSTNGVLKHVHGVSMPVAITALAYSEPQNRLALGTVEGTVLIRQKGPSFDQKKRQREPKAGTYAFFTRGMNAEPSVEDYIPEEHHKHKKLHDFDVALKEFRYGDALDEVLTNRNPVEVAAVMEELGRRRGLTTALSNRDEETVEPVLSFTIRYISNPRYMTILLTVANILIDIYGDMVGRSVIVDELFHKLKKHVADEVRTQESLLRLTGELDGLITYIAMADDDDDENPK